LLLGLAGRIVVAEEDDPVADRNAYSIDTDRCDLGDVAFVDERCVEMRPESVLAGDGQ
ncbi:hypothetical protein GN958_ATG19230, partial [Phytophthora infestans]